MIHDQRKWPVVFLAAQKAEKNYDNQNAISHIATTLLLLGDVL